MPPPVLATKCFAPRPREGAVSRPRLLERLDAGFSGGGKLFLVSAPAGFGKTCLLGEWAARGPGGKPGAGIAWLSLDAADGDPARFLLYVAASLNSAEPSCGSDAMAALQSARQPALEEILSDLINEIDGSLRDILLVLDDYHATDSPGVDAALAFLLERLPPRMRVALATREDPSLPLARLRARGELTELRAADLRFTCAEAADFLGRSTGLKLTGEEAAALEERTEGWIAGLQLAALSMRDQRDVAGFIASFTGSHRFVLDYLVEEVLHGETEGTQAFLLRTSVLDRLCGPLCDALSRGEPDEGPPGQERLEYLDRANLFIVPLDGERKWYRYHRLFAELLRQRLDQSLGGEGRAREGVAALRLRASRWCEANGLPIEAFKYAAAAGDLDRAESLMTSREMPIHAREAAIAILDWLSSLTQAELAARPSLRLRFAAMSLVAGRAVGVEEALDAAEAGLRSGGDAEANRGLLGQVAAARATLAVTRYRPDEILAQSSLALELLRPDDLGFRMTATWAMALAQLLKGDRAAVGEAFAGLESMSRVAGDLFFEQLALCGLAEARERETRLREAAATFRRALVLFGEHPQPNANEAHLGLARILYEWNELDAAEEEAERALALARQYDPTIDRFILCELLLARIKLATGRAAAAAARLETLAATAAEPRFRHRLPEIEEQRALALLRAGDVAGAESLAGSAGQPLLRARVLLAKGEADAALTLLESLRAEAVSRGWRDAELRARAPLALALEARGRGDEALRELAGLLEAAEAESFLRLFLDEGEPMRRLVARGLERGALPRYGDTVRIAFAAERAAGGPATAAAAPLGRRARALLDPLSERELEVLRLLAEGLSNQEIGERLFLALDTIKGHNRRIFDKLDAARRTEAVARARELGLLP